MTSPFTGGRTELRIKKEESVFRKEKFEIFSSYYICIDTGKDFATSEQMDLDLRQVYNQYRERLRIPFPEQIKMIREQYDASASMMSLILGLGTHQYRNYEDGEMPSLSNAKLIWVVREPRNFKELVEEKKDTLKESQTQKLIKRIHDLIEVKRKINSFDRLKGFMWDAFDLPDKFSGYTVSNFEKYANMILFFYEEIGDRLFTVRLNKLMFYSDFYHYKKFGKSISGTKYRAIEMGPVPDDYQFKFSYLLEKRFLKGLLKNIEVDNSKEEVVQYHPLLSSDKSLFSKTEIEVMKKIIEEFKFKKTSEIVEQSHEEKAWIENHKNNELISYQDYAFLLEGIKDNS